MAGVCQRAGSLELRDRYRTGKREKVGQKHFLRALEEVPVTITSDMERRYKAFAAERQVGRRDEVQGESMTDGGGGAVDILVRAVIDLGASLARWKMR